MAYGIKALSKIQIGQETAAGTAVAATAVWRGEGVLNDERTIMQVPEDVGFMQSIGRTVVTALDASVELSATPATFEQVPYLFAMGVEDVTSGAADGSGSGYIYQYDFPTSAVASAPQTCTIEGGDNTGVSEIEYCYLEEMTLSWTRNETVNVSATLRGRQNTAGVSFTGSLDAPTVEEVLGAKTHIYIDATGGTIGTTEKTGTLLGGSLTIRPYWKEAGARTDTYFNTIKQAPTGPFIEGTLLFEHDATGLAERNAAAAETMRLLRLRWLGSALTTTGTAYTYKTLNIQTPIMYDAVPSLGEQDGDDTVELSFHSIYSVADTLGAQIIVVNTNATLA